MNKIENLVIDSDAIKNIKINTIKTKFYIDTEQEISISVNNTVILSSENIIKIEDNSIKLTSDYILDDNDIVVVIYNKLVE